MWILKGLRPLWGPTRYRALFLPAREGAIKGDWERLVQLQKETQVTGLVETHLGAVSHVSSGEKDCGRIAIISKTLQVNDGSI